MAASPHVLVVDDDQDVRNVLSCYFSGYGLTTTTAASGSEMRAALARGSIDIVLLDLGLPGEDGLTLTRELRREWNGGLIIVTGRGEPVDRVVGLELGADDYVAKPFNLRELLARVRSVLRRRDVGGAASPDALPAGYDFAGFRLDPAARELSDSRGEPVNLTDGEYRLLLVLVEHPGHVLSRDQLMEHLHGHDAGPFDRAIDVQIGRLRRKIEPDPSHPTLIKSVRNAGYVFTVGVSRRARP